MSGLIFSQNSNQGRFYDPKDWIPKEPPMPKGCQKYTFYGITVVALNSKSAKKKCARLLKEGK